MKVIFLDLDGVLNVEVFITAVVDVCKREGLDFNKHLHDQYGNLFCPMATGMLKHLIDRTNAKIVISSTWRSSGLEKMKQMWLDRSLPGEVIGVTPHYRYLFGDIDLAFDEKFERGFEIQSYLDDHPEITNYLILDDDNDMLPSQLSNFIQTHEQYGITREDVTKGIEILNS